MHLPGSVNAPAVETANPLMTVEARRGQAKN
jgi:hypothetical protein